MAINITGSVSRNPSRFTYRLYCEEVEANSAANTSKVKVTIMIDSGGSSRWASRDAAATHTITINGTAYTATSGAYVLQGGTTTHIATVTSNAITHESNGSKTVSISGSSPDLAQGNGYGPYSGSAGPGNFTLTTFARNSYTNSKPDFTAPNSVTCSISRYAEFSHTVKLQLKNSAGNWVDCGSLSNQGTSATFSGETIMKACYTTLAQRNSCASRFAIYTNGPNGWTYGPEGTCSAAAINTVNAPAFTATNSASTTITKGNSAFTTTISVTINGQTIGSVSQTSGTSFTFNNTTALRKACITGLAQTASKNYTVTATTYYSGVRVRSTTSTATGTCSAPAADTVNMPNFTAGNNLTVTVTSASSELSRAITLQIQKSDNSWVNIATQARTTTKSFTWANTEAQRDIIFGAIQQAASRATRLLVTTYYDTVVVRSQTTTTGTCSAPAASTCGAFTFTAGVNFETTVNRASSLLTHTVVFKMKDSSGTLQTLATITKASQTTVGFSASTDNTTKVFQYLAQAASRETQISITTYYKNIQIRSTLSANGTCTAPAATTLQSNNNVNWIAGDEKTFTLTRANQNFTHTVAIKVNSQTIMTMANVGTSITLSANDTIRTATFNAMLGSNSKGSEIVITTYYNGVQVRTSTSKTGTCTAPSTVVPTAPNFTAGNGFQTSITLSKSYLYYDISLKVGTVTVQTYSKQQATSLGFATSIADNIKAYQGLNTNAQANSEFVVQMYYKKADGTYIAVGISKSTNGTCTALEANTITAPNWTAGSSFVATITRKSMNLFSTVKLKVAGIEVQTYENQDFDSLNFGLTFGNTVAINKNIFTALAQASSKTATLEITTYYGLSATNKAQVRTTVISTGLCRASEVSVGTLTSDQPQAIIDNTKITCNLTKPLADYTIKVEIYYNGQLITTMQPATSDNKIVFESKNYMESLYKKIPESTSAPLEFKVITYYSGVQVQQPKSIIINMNAKEETVKVKIDNTVTFNTTSRIPNKTNTFIDNTSMIGSNMSDLLVEMAQGYFYLQSKYGGYLKQIKIIIGERQETLIVESFNELDKIENTEKTKIVSKGFTGTGTSGTGIVMGPYSFSDIVEIKENINLTITATDSRGYTVTKTVPLRIFPYLSPTIKIVTNNSGTILKTDRIEESDGQFLNISLGGSVSSLYKVNGTTKTQTNTLQNLTLKYRVYGSTAAFSSFELLTYSTEDGKFAYTNDYKLYNVTNYSTAQQNLDFNINDTWELLIEVKDKFGKTNSDSIIILPNRPLLSFRDSQIGINIIPRKLTNITTRNSEEGENPALDINGYIYSNGREVPTFEITNTWTR